MKRFEVFRYLKKFAILVFIVSCLGVALTYAYTNSHQKYTASTVIRYTNREIEQGLAPDGSALDVNEIYSSTVVTQAMEFLGNNGPLNVIRSRCNVKEIVPEEQKSINEAIIDKGEKTTYFPDTYKVELVVDGQYGEKYARDALDAIIQSYCTYYTEKYVEQKLSLIPSADLLDGGYDYYECVRILENDTNEMIEFLKKKKDDHPNFRSSQTGYSYADLYDIYVSFKNYVLPELYATVLNGPLVKDATVLKDHIANDIAVSVQNEQVKSEQREKISLLIDNYVTKNLGMPGELDDGDTIASDYIMSQIEERGAGAGAQTTYDGLILEVVGIDKLIASEAIDSRFNSDMLASFNGVATGGYGSDAQRENIEKMINDYEDELADHYEIVNTTGKELNLAVSTDYLKMISTVRVYPSVNAKLYILLALVLFFIIGCVGAVVLGRLEDIVLYMLYTDKKTGLANREKLNIYINELAGKMLTDDFTCVVVKLENLNELNRRYGYTVGDGVLKDLADIVKVMGDTDGVIGYNGAGRYQAFFEKCNEKKASVIIKILESQVQTYNELHKDYPMTIKAASETSTSSGIYDIRDMLRGAIMKLEDSESEA